MTFKLRDAKAAERLQPGAKVIFEVKIEPEAGEYVIESIRPVGGSGQ
jgi:Copper binding periplasmic protein CusF.